MSANMTSEDTSSYAANAGAGATGADASRDPQPTTQSDTPGGPQAASGDPVVIIEGTCQSPSTQPASANAPGALELDGASATSEEPVSGSAHTSGQQGTRAGDGLADVLPSGRQVVLILVGLVASGKVCQKLVFGFVPLYADCLTSSPLCLSTVVIGHSMLCPAFAWSWLFGCRIGCACFGPQMHCSPPLSPPPLSVRVHWWLRPQSTFAQALERHFPQFRRCNQDELGDRRSVEALTQQSLREGLSVVIDRTNFDERCARFLWWRYIVLNVCLLLRLDSQRATWIRIARSVPGTLVWVIVFDTPYEVSSVSSLIRSVIPNSCCWRYALQGSGTVSAYKLRYPSFPELTRKRNLQVRDIQRSRHPNSGSKCWSASSRCSARPFPTRATRGSCTSSPQTFHRHPS